MALCVILEIYLSCLHFFYFFFLSLLNFGMYLFLLFDIFDGCMIVRNTVMMKRVSKEIGLLWFDIFDGYMVIRNTFMMKKGSRKIVFFCGI